MKVQKISQTFLTASLIAVSAIAFTGCSVARHQQTVGSYMDDAGITTAVKAKFAEDKTVAATSISVETMNGNVQLSGFAKNQAEKDRAAALARDTKGVTGVKNSIVVRP